MSQYRRKGSNSKADHTASRLIQFVIIGIIVLVFIGIASGGCSNQNDDWDSSVSSSYSEDSSSNTNTVPWDYRIVEGTVGDLIGSDMTVLPDNELIPNDDNYGTGDQVWTLQAMEADMNTNSQDRADVTLTAWESLKTFKSKQAAQEDLDKLKIQLKTEVDLVGVYKTEYQGKMRQFAVITLPSGQNVKQPIDADRYQSFKSLKKVNIILEEVHDFSNYDLTYAKFRGWAK